MWMRSNSLAVSRRPTPVYGGSPYALLAGLGAINLSSTIGQGQGAGAGAEAGAIKGASLTPIAPFLGAAIGAIVGAIAGAIGKKDPESANFDQAIAIYNAQGPNGVLNIPNKYLVLAGLFDLKSIHTNIPIYKKYGRMGEQKFVTDMCNLIYLAGQSGKITGSDTPLTVMSRIVQPWIDSWGYGPMADPNANMINTILLGMVAEYLMGGQGLWLDVNGNNPFKSLPTFSLPAAAAPVTAPPVTPAGTVNPNLLSSSPAPSIPQISPSGLSVTPPMTTPIVTPFGTFSFGGPDTGHPGNYWINGPGGPQTGSGSKMLWTGTALQVLGTDGGVYQWTAAQPGWIQIAAGPPASPTSAVVPSAVVPAGGVPAGYTITTSNTPDGQPVYLGPGGAFFVRQPSSGSLMPLASYLASLPVAPTTTVSGANPTPAAPAVVATPSGQQIDVNALAQTLLAQGQSQAQAYQSALSALQSAGVQPTAAVQAATQQAVQAAGTAPEASSGVWWIAGLLALVGIGFATARPAARRPRSRMRMSR